MTPKERWWLVVCPLVVCGGSNLVLNEGRTTVNELATKLIMEKN